MAKTLETALNETEDIQIDSEILNSKPDEILGRAKLIENETKFLKNELTRLTHEQMAMKEKIKENNEKIKLNKQLPYLVANVVEVFILFLIIIKKNFFKKILDIIEDEEEEGSSMDADKQTNKGKCAVIKTSTRQVKFF